MRYWARQGESELPRWPPLRDGAPRTGCACAAALRSWQTTPSRLAQRCRPSDSGGRALEGNSGGSRGARNVLLLATHTLPNTQTISALRTLTRWWESRGHRQITEVSVGRRNETGRAEAEWSEQLSALAAEQRTKTREPVRQLLKEEPSRQRTEAGRDPGGGHAWHVWRTGKSPCKRLRRQEAARAGRGPGPDWPRHRPLWGESQQEDALTPTLKGLFSHTKTRLHRRQRWGELVGSHGVNSDEKGRWLRRGGREQCLNSRYVHSEARAKRTCGQDKRRRREEEGNPGWLQGFLLPGTAGELLLTEMKTVGELDLDWKTGAQFWTCFSVE